MHSRLAFATFLALSVSALAEPAVVPAPELVNIKSVDPTIVVELRYATSRNVVGRPLYPPKMPALIRPSVAERLRLAQAYLQPRGFRLKIWDAYRPKIAQDQLWQFLPDRNFVSNPADSTPLHTWGVAVDATIVYANGHAVSMPTDFDEFTPAAMLRYTGSDPNVRQHLRLLQRAMAQAGFLGMRTEWWHFIAPDWRKYGPIEDPTVTGAQPASSSRPPSAGSQGDHRSASAR
ncbi:MAG TPA: M15 family metallopeptidase [Chthoniobacterales bacterium]|nr:M15 family metallopeptidase [Chthoniobacterales bacterium]